METTANADLAFDDWMRRLYERALREQWHVERDVAWDALALERLPAPIRRAMSATYGHIHHAESFGLALCGRLVDATPAGPARQFAATQVMDEARHVDFFTRLLQRLGAPGLDSPGLRALEQEMQDVRDDAELLTHAQVVENAAQTFFVEAARLSRRTMQGAVRLPGSDAVARLLQALIELVGRDEARHIAFGQRYLAERLRGMRASERARLEQRAHRFCVLFHASFAELRPHVSRLGLPADEVLARVWAAQRKQLRRVGLEIGSLEAAPDADATPGT